jgi:hypothetical protein
MITFGALGAQGQWVDWSNQYPYQGHRVYSHMMHRTSDGNLLLCASIHGGWTQGSGIPFEDPVIAMYLVNTDPTGDTLWTVRSDSIKPWAITRVVDLIDGNTLIAGTASSSYTYCGLAVTGLPMPQLFALKIDPYGNVLWWHQYDQACSRTLADAWETPDEQIHLLVLDTQQPNIQIGFEPPNWFEHHSLDASGVTLGMTTHQQADVYYGGQYGAALFQGGRYVLASAIDTVGQNTRFIQLEKLDAFGVPQSAVFITDTSYRDPIDLVAAPDRGLLMVLRQDISRSRLVHADTLGNIHWDRTYATGFQQVLALPDTTYLAVGTHGSFQSPNMREVCVTLISSTGDSLWSRFYGDSLNDLGSGIVRTSNGFIAYGTKDMYSGSVPPRLFLTWDTLGLLLNVPDAVPVRDELTIFPNPASDEVVMLWSKPMNGRAEITVYDPQGRLALRQFVATGSIRASLNTGVLANGCYLVHMRSQNAELSGRLLVVH